MLISVWLTTVLFVPLGSRVVTLLTLLVIIMDPLLVVMLLVSFMVVVPLRSVNVLV